MVFVHSFEKFQNHIKSSEIQSLAMCENLYNLFVCFCSVFGACVKQEQHSSHHSDHSIIFALCDYRTSPLVIVIVVVDFSFANLFNFFSFNLNLLYFSHLHLAFFFCILTSHENVHDYCSSSGRAHVALFCFAVVFFFWVRVFCSTPICCS